MKKIARSLREHRELIGVSALALLGFFVYWGLWLPAIFTLLLIWFLFWLGKHSK
jgi:hypothetical protein